MRAFLYADSLEKKIFALLIGTRDKKSDKKTAGNEFSAYADIFLIFVVIFAQQQAISVDTYTQAYALEKREWDGKCKQHLVQIPVCAALVHSTYSCEHYLCATSGDQIRPPAPPPLSTKTNIYKMQASEVANEAAKENKGVGGGPKEDGARQTVPPTTSVLGAQPPSHLPLTALFVNTFWIMQTPPTQTCLAHTHTPQHSHWGLHSNELLPISLPPEPQLRLKSNTRRWRFYRFQMCHLSSLSRLFPCSICKCLA